MSQEFNVAISNFRKSVGKAIAKQRKHQGLTQEQLGEKLGLETETVNRMERRVTSLTLERLEELANILECPVRSFLWYDEGDAQEQAEAIVNMLRHLPPERRAHVVRFVEEVVQVLQP